MRMTKSNLAASRYLGCSYQHYKKWAKFYTSDKEEFETLFDEHLNPSGKGIPKFLSTHGAKPPLKDIIEGRLDPSSFTPEVLKTRLIEEGYLEEKCARCGFNERRILDYKMPLLLHFKDNNKKNWRKENIELLCYNDFFLTVGNIFNNKQIRGIEDHKQVYNSQVDWKIDDYHIKQLEKLGLNPKEEEEFDIISYNK